MEYCNRVEGSREGPGLACSLKKGSVTTGCDGGSV